MDGGRPVDLVVRGVGAIFTGVVGVGLGVWLIIHQFASFAPSAFLLGVGWILVGVSSAFVIAGAVAVVLAPALEPDPARPGDRNR